MPYGVKNRGRLSTNEDWMNLVVEKNKVDSHSLGPFFRVVVPLVRLQLVSLHGSKRIDVMRTERRVNVLWEKLASFRPILAPVRMVAYSTVCSGWGKTNGTFEKIK